MYADGNSVLDESSVYPYVDLHHHFGDARILNKNGRVRVCPIGEGGRRFVS